MQDIKIKLREALATWNQQGKADIYAVFSDLPALLDQMDSLQTKQDELQTQITVLLKMNDVLERRASAGEALAKDIQDPCCHFTREYCTCNKKRDAALNAYREATK